MSDCKLLGNWYSYLIQFTLGIVAFGSLYIKRKYENPKRPKKIWILDISKQIIGGLFAHLCNMLIAYILGNNNPCLWYFINYFIDVFVGVILCYYMLKIVNYVSIKYPKYNIYETGIYYSPQHTKEHQRYWGQPSTNKAAMYCQLESQNIVFAQKCFRYTNKK